MICPKGWKNCTVCKEPPDFWEDQWQGLKAFVRWKELVALLIFLSISYIFWHWWGLLVGLIISGIMQTVNFGQFFVKDYPLFPDYQEPATKCVAGHVNCEICDKDGKIYK